MNVTFEHFRDMWSKYVKDILFRLSLGVILLRPLLENSNPGRTLNRFSGKIIIVSGNGIAACQNLKDYYTF